MKHLSKGQTIIELLVALAVASIFLPGLAVGIVASQNGKAQQGQRSDAVTLLREGNEVVRMVREKGWNAFAIDGTYHPVLSNGIWTLQSGPETVRGFTRQIQIADVYRDTNGAIVQSGGSVDPSTKKVTITVSWGTPLPTSVSTMSYLTRYLDNLSLTQTTASDFKAGTLIGTNVTNTSGGEVSLGAGGQGDWCSPNLTINALDLPGQGITTDITALQGHAYMTTGGNSSGDSMDSVNITNTKPPVPTNAGSYNNYKTYGIYADTGFTYLTSDHPGMTVDIIENTTLPYTETGTFNASGGGTGDSIFATGNVGFVTAGNYLYTFDLSSKSGSRSQLGRVQLAGAGQRVTVVGNYAYVATNSTTTQLQVINVSNPASMSVVGNINVGNGGSGVDVYVNQTGTRAYLATTYITGKQNVFIIDTTTKTSLVIKGSVSTNGMSPKGLVVVPGNRMIVVGSGGTQQYQVFDIVTETAPTSCGGLSSPNGATSVNAVATVLESDGDAYAYILTNDSSKEFQIIEGGPGGQYATSGTFESSVFDSGYDTAFNRFTYTADVPVQTSIKFQLGVASAVNNSCSGATFTFVGPDKTTGTYFTAPGGIPFGTVSTYTNPGRCFKYKAYFSTNDSLSSPVLKDVTVNYSP